MTRFSAYMARFEGDPAWYGTVEALYRERLATWLDQHGYRYCWDCDEFTVDERTWTVLQLWQPVPELDLRRE